MSHISTEEQGPHHDVEAMLSALCIDLGYPITPSDLVVHLPLIGRPSMIASFAFCGFKLDGHLNNEPTKAISNTSSLGMPGD